MERLLLSLVMLIRTRAYGGEEGQAAGEGKRKVAVNIWRGAMKRNAWGIVAPEWQNIRRIRRI